MLADWFSVWDNFKNFIGGRDGLLHWGIFCIALLGCAALGKKERKLLFWPTVLTMIFFFNPLFFRYIGNKFLSGVYWRLMWMVPVSFVIAYFFVKVIYRFRRKAVRFIAVAAAISAIIVTGDRIYTKETFQKAENDYKLPQAAIEVADVMAAAGVDWKVKVVVPNELLCYIRQYRCDVGLFYGRNAGGFISDIGEDEQKVYEQMSNGTPDMSVITEIGKKHEVVFLCFNMEEQTVPENMSVYDYHWYRTVGDYNIYMLKKD